jgi:hypothetical protein
MHAYRDAIRDRDGNRIVRYAATMYPGATVSFRSPLSSHAEIEAIRTYPGESGGLSEHLTSLLTRVLSDAASRGPRELL